MSSSVPPVNSIALVGRLTADRVLVLCAPQALS